ncbi:MAG: hypothetical protein RIS70_2623 [Planctomycetota bacterium]
MADDSKSILPMPVRSRGERVTVPADSLGRDSMVISQGCRLCGFTRFEIVGEWDRHGDPLRTVACWRCGLVSHAQIPNAEELRKFYEQEYRSAYNGEEVPSPKRIVREWDRARHRFESMRPYLRDGDRVFEIGAGAGCNLKQFQLAGYRVDGIEPGPGFSQFARERLHCPVECKTLEQVGGTGEYDVALLIHVLEHLPEPRQALGRIRQLLRPGGRLYVEVPNLAAPHAAPGKIFHKAHIHNFTPWSLAALASATGFEVAKVFSRERDRNLAMCLSCGSSARLQYDPDGYFRTKSALERYSTLRYHCRPQYVATRVSEVAQEVRRRWQMQKSYAEILKICQGTTCNPVRTESLRPAA